jgi:hypothetical protein
MGGGEQEMIDPFTAFAIAQGAVAGIKKQLPLVRTSTASIKNSAVSTKRQIRFM